MPEGRRPRGVTPRLRSGAAAESARLRRRRNGREELPHVRSQGQQPRGATQCLRSGAAAGRSYPPLEARGCRGRSNPTSKELMAARVREGLEMLFHAQGQKGPR